ncbi:MAG: hypothetical protein PVH88_02050 [Ignavibacteria bacterium]|jgi:hypothetical protein
MKCNYELGFLNHSVGNKCTECDSYSFELIDKTEDQVELGNRIVGVMKCLDCGNIFWNHIDSDPTIYWFDVGDKHIEERSQLPEPIRKVSINN